MSQELIDFVNRQRAKGVDREHLRKLLVAKGWDPITVHRVIAGLPLYDSRHEAQPKPLHLKASTYFLFAGILLILIASLIFITYNWPNLSHFSRFLVIAVPNLLLFILSFNLIKEEYEHIHEATEVTGLLLLPVTVGTFIYQFGLVDKADNWLASLSLMICLPLYVLYVLTKKGGASIMIVVFNILFATFYLLNSDMFEASGKAFITLILAIIGFILVVYLKNQTDQKALFYLETVTSMAFIFSIPTLIASLSYSSFGNGSATAAILISVLGGGLLVLVALTYGVLVKSWSILEVIQQRIILVFALIMIILPLCQPSNVPLLLVLSLLLSGIVIYLGLSSGTKLLTVGGIIGGTFTLLNLLTGTIDTSIVMILIFALGFTAIFISIMIIKYHHEDKGLLRLDWSEKIGIIGDERSRDLRWHKDAERISRFQVLLRVIFIVIAILIASIVFDTALSNTSSTNIIENSNQPILQL